jgi:hypothetical protein
VRLPLVKFSRDDERAHPRRDRRNSALAVVMPFAKKTILAIFPVEEKRVPWFDSVRPITAVVKRETYGGGCCWTGKPLSPLTTPVMRIVPTRGPTGPEYGWAE